MSRIGHENSDWIENVKTELKIYYMSKYLKENIQSSETYSIMCDENLFESVRKYFINVFSI